MTFEQITEKINEDIRHFTSMYNHARENKKYYDATRLKEFIEYAEILKRYLN